jgi:hypothetical protein
MTEEVRAIDVTPYISASVSLHTDLSFLGERLVRLQHPRLTIFIYLGYSNCSHTLIMLS